MLWARGKRASDEERVRFVNGDGTQKGHLGEDRLSLRSLADRQPLPVHLDDHEHRTPKQKTNKQHGVRESPAPAIVRSRFSAITPTRELVQT